MGSACQGESMNGIGSWGHSGGASRPREQRSEGTRVRGRWGVTLEAAEQAAGLEAQERDNRVCVSTGGSTGEPGRELHGHRSPLPDQASPGRACACAAAPRIDAQRGT